MKTTVKTLAIMSFLLIGSLMLMGQKTLLFKDAQPRMVFVSGIKDDVEMSAGYNKVQLALV